MNERPDPRLGVFDTLLVQGGAPVALAAHLRRLTRSVEELYGESLDVAALAAQVGSVAGLAPLQRVRLDFTPGEGVSVVAQPITERPRDSLRLVVRRVPGGWGGHKWRDRSLLDEWGSPEDPQAEVLLVDEDDLLLETRRGNVFVVLEGETREVVAPPLDGRILPGVTRATVLDQLAGVGIDGETRPVSLAELTGASEVFVTSSIGGVRAVIDCAGIGSWPVGPVTRAADAAVERVWDGA